MVVFHFLLPALFAAGTLHCRQTSASADQNSSLWEYKEGVSHGTCFLGSIGEIKKDVLEKCFERSNTSRVTDLVDLESFLEFQAKSDRDFIHKEDNFLLKIKRSNRTENKTHGCSPLSDTKGILNRILFPMILVLGLTLNGILLHIYRKHKELRTQRNALFMNLAVSDALFLLVFGVLQIISRMRHLEFSCFPSGLCRTQVFFVCVWASVGAYSVTLISIQRYLRVVKFTKPIINRSVKIFVKPASLITTIWTLAILLAIPEVARSRMSFQGFKCRDPSIFIHGAYPFVLYGALPFTIAAGFYWAVQRRPLQERLGAEFPKGDRPGRVLLSLGFVYVLTYAPILVCDILKTGEDPVPREIYCYISRLFHLLNPVLCPIALCCASRRLRKYFIRYILCRCICSDVNGSPQASFFEPSVSERRSTFPDTTIAQTSSVVLQMVEFKETQESIENDVSAL